MKTFLSLLFCLSLFSSGIFSQESGMRSGQVPPELAYHSFTRDEAVAYKGDDFKYKVFLIDF